jgi:hypothetical protein
MILFLLFGLLPDETIIRENCDRIELNHFYSREGNPIGSQVIYWEWNVKASRFRVRDFYCLRAGKPERPRWDAARVCYLFRYWNMGRLYEVESPSFMETWTPYDPELVDREFFTTVLRQGFSKTPPAKVNCGY